MATSAVNERKPGTVIEIHTLAHDTFMPIAQAAYKARGGQDPDLPGRGTVPGSKRADARFALDAAGELLVYSKTDGMIRQVVGAK